MGRGVVIKKAKLPKLKLSKLRKWVLEWIIINLIWALALMLKLRARLLVIIILDVETLESTITKTSGITGRGGLGGSVQLCNIITSIFFLECYKNIYIL